MIVLIALVCYTAAWASLLSTIRKREPLEYAFRLALPLGIVLHTYIALQTMHLPEGIQLGFFQMSSLLFAVINIIISISALRRPLSNLFLIALPLAALSIVLASYIPASDAISLSLGYGMVLHIVLSILAYSLLTIATLQAILLNYQNNQLKSHHAKSVIGIFPPLQTMETLLFDLVWAGFILLTLSVATGVYFIEDILEQRLSHKSLFSIISWALYATLLFGRHILGWRGKTAIRWVIAGFIMLMLAYFGSKFVIEFLINA